MAQGKNYLQQQYIRSTIEHIALVLSAEVWKVIATCSVPMQCGIVKDNPKNWLLVLKQSKWSFRT